MSNTFNIVSINVGYGMLMEKLLPYIRRNADSVSVFCFQETDRATQLTLDAILLEDFEGFYSTKNVGNDGFHLSTYVRRGTTVYKKQTVLHDVQGAGEALTCHIFSPLLGQKLLITNVHGNSQPGHKLDTPERVLQSSTLLRSFEHSRESHVYIGDFNLLPEAESVQLFSKNGYTDLIHEYDIPTTRNDVAWKKYPDNKQLFADYAFVKGFGPSDYSFRVDSETVSDHLPLILTLNQVLKVPRGKESALLLLNVIREA